MHLQAGYFGLYVDSTFERGMSRPCSTYNNQCLAADEVRQQYRMTSTGIYLHDWTF